MEKSLELIANLLYFLAGKAFFYFKFNCHIFVFSIYLLLFLLVE